MRLSGILIIIVGLNSSALAQSLFTGATPYAYCYGKNLVCNEFGCSEISVKAPHNSDVMVTIKKGDRVKKHAYIRAGGTYSFSFPNGTYQPFFYYGNNWDPNKLMKSSPCGGIKGGFTTGEHFGKDSPQRLYNQALSYELILQPNGNFSTRPSSAVEAF
jgi:hypothetical protein